MKSKRFNEGKARTLVKTLLSVINYCHGEGVVHRDLKPANLIMTNFSPMEQAVLKIVDFGLADRLPIGSVMHAPCGTPGYMCPEMLTSPATYDHRCDVYASGKIFFNVVSCDLDATGETRVRQLTHDSWRRMPTSFQQIFGIMTAPARDMRCSAHDAFWNLANERGPEIRPPNCLVHIANRHCTNTQDQTSSNPSQAAATRLGNKSVRRSAV